MKTLYITDSGTVMLDEDKQSVSSCKSQREAIQRIFTVTEDTHIVIENYNNTKDKVELDAKANDIIIIFYEECYPHGVIVVNSPEWNENMTAYNTKMETIAANRLSKCDGDCDCKCVC